jgi:ribosomal protein S18 acetylase RimI-like enzyme
VDVVRLDDSRLGEASDVLSRAFQDDPAWVWLIPDDERRRQLLPWLFRVGFDVTAAEVWTTTGPVLGAARWLPPGRPPMRVGPTLKALVTTPYGRAVEALRTQAMPDPHWYLAGIGVDPSAQRRGVGAALMQPGLAAAARAALPAVLLTNNEANLSFYRRNGFAVVRESETPKGGPHAWAMVKAP